MEEEVKPRDFTGAVFMLGMCVGILILIFVVMPDERQTSYNRGYDDGVLHGRSQALFEQPTIWEMRSPCQEDEALYPVISRVLPLVDFSVTASVPAHSIVGAQLHARIMAYPEGRLQCVNIEELAQ